MVQNLNKKAQHTVNMNVVIFCITFCQRLVRVCGEIKAAPSETEEIQFLCTVCAKLKAQPYLVNFFIEVRKYDYSTVRMW